MSHLEYYNSDYTLTGTDHESQRYTILKYTITFSPISEYSRQGLALNSISLCFYLQSENASLKSMKIGGKISQEFL